MDNDGVNALPAKAPMDWQTISDGLDVGLVPIDNDGVVIEINRAACEMLGISRAEAIGQECTRVFGDDRRQLSGVIRRSMALSEPLWGYETEILSRSGQRRTVQMRVMISREDGTGRGAVVVMVDVSELVRLRQDLGQRTKLHNLVGKSKAMQEVFSLIEQVADSDASVLIEGETGTGKEMVARAIHFLSHRAAGPFVAVSCAALVESLLESELFGHVRGAFTGAVADKRGRFEAASGGTIFLDEVGELSAATQVKLLRALQGHRIERVGDDHSIPVDIRVIAATNRSLVRLVKSGPFRQDLYYRLRVVPLYLPSLRDRREDIPLLAEHFVEQFRRQTDRPIQGIDPHAAACLLDYTWPGNVRELENAIEYAFVTTRRGLIGQENLPTEIRRYAMAQHDGPRSRSRAEITPNMQPRRHWLTQDAVSDALRLSDWNVAKAARRLGISRTTLYKRIHDYGLRKPAS